MADLRQRIPLQSSYSFSSLSAASTSDDQPSRSLKRRYTSADIDSITSAPVMDPFRSQSHYPDSAYTQAKSSSARQSGSRLAVATLPAMDPTPDDDDAIFIHPPFTDYPDAAKHREGLTYNLMATNPNWFLDPADYQTVNGGNPSAVKYPTQLEPPRGWCPSKKKEVKEGWPEGEEPRLRCTFCRRTYAGVNAKSMWRRHVFEKHKIAMSNRRADNQERKGRGSNKENKEDSMRSTAARGAARAELELEATMKASAARRIRGRSEQPQDTYHASSSQASSSRMNFEDADDDDDIESPVASQPQLVIGDSSVNLDHDHNDLFGVATSSSTPPLTPGLSPSSSLSRLANAKPETPYNPLLTPSFRHSPARQPSDQPWRFPSPSHPLHSSARELSLSMLVCGEASPVVRGLDVSPVVLVPASERSKRSIFSSPHFMSKKDAETPKEGALERLKAMTKPSPRRLFSESVLPTPLTDRLKFQKYRIPESPLGRGFTPIKPKGRISLSHSDATRSALSPFKTPSKGTGLMGPIDLEGEDPFADNLYKTWLRSPAVVVETRADSPPDSSPECESPVIRSIQSQADTLDLQPPPMLAAANSGGLGIGLMEGFSLKDRTASNSTADPNSSEAEVDEELMLVRNERKRPAKWLARSFVTADGSPAPVVQTGKKVRREFLMDRLLNGEYDMHEASLPRKRRKTLNGHD